MKPTSPSKSDLYQTLQKIKSKYSKPEFLHSDPIALVHRYRTPYDREIVAIIVALYSYGNVSAICNFLNRLLIQLTEYPYEYLKNSYIPKNLENLIGNYRFQKESDTLEFLRVLSVLIQSKAKHDNGNLFENYFFTEENAYNKGILQFQNKIRSLLKFDSYGLRFLLGQGMKNSPNKRYNMFLRWMTGEQYPDLGLYKLIPQKTILLPLDTHITRIGKVLSLTNHKTTGLKMAIEITDRLSEICREPAIRYDFALSRIGILGRCRAEYIETICNHCEIRKVCKYYPSKQSAPISELEQ